MTSIKNICNFKKRSHCPFSSSVGQEEIFPSPQDIQGQWKSEYSFKFSGVVDLQSIPKLMKKKMPWLKESCGVYMHE